MSEIILIATTHKEKGKCNSLALLKIIQDIKPDVIFEELSPNFFNQIYQGSMQDSLETCSIKSYLLEYKGAKHVPVDADGNQLINKELKMSINKMLDYFDQQHEYENLRLELNKRAKEVGFKYLNSRECEALFAQKYYLEQQLAVNCISENLVKTHKIWINIQDYRERYMLNNIYQFYDQNEFDKAIFLVGAEHRKPIIDLIEQEEFEKRTSVNWNFNYFKS